MMGPPLLARNGAIPNLLQCNMLLVQFDAGGASRVWKRLVQLAFQRLNPNFKRDDSTVNLCLP